jgi:N-acetyl-anhydromuramyl-L-alanine amidase AmpD
MFPVTHLTIHCAATPEGRNVPAHEVEQWDRARFNQPSYHWIVELDGTAHRSLQDGVRGAHTGGHNTGNIGICYVGGCDVHMQAKDTRTPEQIAALAHLVRQYQDKYPGLTVLGHRDWPNVHKDCPSFDVRSWLVAEGLA